MSTLRITQVRSTIGRTQDQRNTVRSLGLKRIRHTVEQPDRPEIRGMLRKIPHLVEFEVLDGDDTAAAPAADTPAAPVADTSEES
jgi:large subunit ribosomal protein L30